MSIEFADAPTLTTARLRLRPWREADVEAFVAMSADREVMAYFPATLSRADTIDYVAELQARFRRWGYGYWALESDDIAFAGFVGLSQPKIDAHFTPCVEIGWRLARAAWGRGYATEGAAAALRHGFVEREIDEIVAMVSAENTPSRRVAERLGMSRDTADDFDFPGDEAWKYRRTVLYRLDRETFSARIG